eukprot:m.98566 g.98566  ORF g.98566 m.98566 type:complete len:807 (+) comp14011_c1_seq1:2010-4430(+)
MFIFNTVLTAASLPSSCPISSNTTTTTTAAEESPSRTHFAAFVLPFTLLQQARLMFAPGSFLFDFWWLLVVCGTVMLISFCSLIRDAPLINTIARALAARAASAWAVVGLWIAAMLGVEAAAMLAEESVFAPFLTSLSLTLAVFSVTRTLTDPALRRTLAHVGRAVLWAAVAASCYLASHVCGLEAAWMRFGIITLFLVSLAAAILEIKSLTPSTLTTEQKEMIMIGALAYFCNWDLLSCGWTFFVLRSCLAISGFVSCGARDKNLLLTTFTSMLLWHQGLVCLVTSAAMPGLKCMFLLLGAFLVVTPPSLHHVGNAVSALLAVLVITLRQDLSELSILFQLVAIIGVCVQFVLCFSLVAARDHNVCHRWALSLLLVSSDIFSDNQSSPIFVFLFTLLLQLGAAVASALSLSTVSMQQLFEAVSLDAFANALLPYARFARPFAALATMALFTLTVLTSPMHISSLPHVLALFASVVVALSVAGESWNLTSLTSAANTLTPLLHLGIYDAIKILFSSLERTLFPAVRTGALFCFRMLTNSLRWAWPAVRDSFRFVTEILLHRAVMLFVGSATVIAIAFAIHEGLLDLSVIWAAWASVVAIKDGVVWAVYALPRLGEMLSQVGRVFFGELDSTRAPLLRFAQYPGFSLLYYVSFSLRSRFRSIATIRVKFFVLPLTFLAFGLAVHRSLLLPLGILVTLWLAGALILYNHNARVARQRLAEIRRERRTQAAPTVSAAPATARPPTKIFEEAECSICMVMLEATDGDRRALQCGHVYHSPCIAEWLARGTPTCPLCRAPQPGAGWAYTVF